MNRTFASLPRIALLAALAALTLGLPSSADDRNLFLSNAEDPYLFMLMDTSGSMSFGLEKGWTNSYESTAVAAQLDDPGSRLYQAKSAIYEVVSNLPQSANIGFAHFSQPGRYDIAGPGLYVYREAQRVLKKHYLYTRQEGTPDPPWYSVLPFPAPGQPLRFGDWQWGLQSGRPSENYGFQFWVNAGGGTVTPWYGCSPGWADTIWSYMGAGIGPLPAASSFDTPEEFQQHRLDRLGYYPHGGANGTVRTIQFTQYDGRSYQVAFEGISSGNLGSPIIEVEVVVNECVYDSTQPSSRRWSVGPEIGRQVFELEPLYTEDREGIPLHGATDFISAGYQTLDYDSTKGFRSFNPCGGWDPNVYSTPLTSGSRENSGATPADAQIVYTTYDDPLGRVDPDTGAAYSTLGTSPFSRGDVIPWDWVNHSAGGSPPAGFERSNRDEFLRRLAPNVFSSGVSLYEGRGQTGIAELFTEDTPDLTGTTIGAGTATSVSIVPGCTAELYSGLNYTGTMTVITDDDPFLGDDTVGDDAVSSLRISCPPEGPDFRTPDFRVANYFADQPTDTGAPFYTHLQTRPEYADNPPLAAQGSTPLAATMRDFRSWLVEWKKTATDPNVGDPDWECRRRFAILLTDGWETCETTAGGADPETDPSVVPIGPVANAASDIYDEGVQVFVIGFAPGSGSDPARMTALGNSLQAAADAGGTGRLSKHNPSGMDCEEFTYLDENGAEQNLCPGPAIASDRESLVKVLNNILSAIEVAPTAFAGAALPSDRSDRNSIFLSDFVPLEGESSWPTRINHFVKPLPLKPDGTPDTDRDCPVGVDDDPVECFAWEANASILGTGPLGHQQAPTETDLAGVTDPDLSDFQLGLNTGERRVYFTMPVPGDDDVPLDKDWLFSWDGSSPTLKAKKYSLWDGLCGMAPEYDCTGDALEYVAGDNASETAAHERAVEILKHTYQIKTGEDPEGETYEWVIGDVFHSTPAVLGAPSDFFYLLDDIEANDQGCWTFSGDDPVWNDDATGYTCFAEKHAFRRRILLAGTNSGLVHAIDAGNWEYSLDSGGGTAIVDEGPQQNYGSGQELFAYAPRAALPRLRLQADGEDRATGTWGVDGPLTLADVFIDPVHTGIPTAADREWRSVTLGGLREGGRSYFALDVTQPDQLESAYLKDPALDISPFDTPAVITAKKKLLAQPLPTDGVASTPSKTRPSNSGYVPSCADNYTASDCGPLEYPTVLWEFDLDDLPSGADVGLSCSPDDPILNPTCGPSLGYTWSKPVVGRIQVTVPAGGNKTNEVVRYVAFIGGGLDPANPADIGNWIYMIDMETGFPIYARQVEGSIPSEVAAVDTDQDNLVDTVYFGTHSGFMYKIDLSIPALLEDVSGASTWPGGRAVLDTEWDPFAIFTTGGRSIFYPPSVVFLAQRNQYALAFGTGDREDLWREQSPPQTGRFFVMLDPGLTADTVPSPIYDETHLIENIQSDSTFVFGDLLDDETYTVTDTQLPGYSFQLAENERLLDRPKTVSGVTAFVTFNPESVATNGVCEATGATNIFAFFTRTSVGLLEDQERFRSVSGLAASLFASTTSGGVTAGGGSGSGSGGGDGGSGSDTGDGPNAEQLDTRMQDIMAALREQMPDNCRFSDHLRVDFQVYQADTQVEMVAPIPICQIVDNWKDL